VLRSITAVAAVAATVTGCGWFIGKDVKRSDFGEAWPLTVESGTLHCQGSDWVTFESNGTTYDVSGGDSPFLSGFGERIGPIWAQDSSGAHKDLDPLETAAEPLCM
jgi:Protein of unknown function (DUF2511)